MTVRVLHLNASDADLQTRTSIRTLMESSGQRFQHVARTIGRGGAYPHLLWAVLALRRDVGSNFDAVHAWDEIGLNAAVIAGAPRIVFSVPAAAFPAHPPEWLRRSAVRRGAVFVCTAPSQQQACAARGIPSEQCRLIRPPLNARPVANDRAAIRARLGLADDEFVMLAPGESTRPADHERAVWAGSILHAVDERYRVLLWGRGPRLDVAATLGDKLRQPRLVVDASRVLPGGREVAYEDLLPAADALLLTARAEVPTLPVAMAMAAGVPVVAVPRPELAEVVVDEVTAFVVANTGPRLIAQRVMDLRADPTAGGAVAGRARARALDLFSRDRFVAQVAELYHERSASPRATLADAAVATGLAV